MLCCTAPLWLNAAACLAPNADFQEKDERDDGDPSPSWDSTQPAKPSPDTQHSAGDGNEGSDDSQSTQSHSTTTDLNKTNTAEPNSSAMSSGSTSLSSPSATQDSNSSPATSSSGDNSSDASSSSSSPGEPDMSQGQWIPLEINQRSAQTLRSGHAVSIRFNHAERVGAGASSNGSDLVVVSMRTGKVVVLDRILDPSSAWNRGDTHIWFATDEAIASGASIRNHYYIVIGHPLLSVRENPSSVFALYDAFDGSTLDTDKWKVTRSKEGSPSYSVANGKLSIDLNSPSGDAAWIRIMAAYPQLQQPNLLFESRAQINPKPDAGSCIREQILTLRSANDDKARASFQQISDRYSFVSYDDDSGTYRQQTVPSHSPSSPAFHFGLRWMNASISLMRSGVSIFEGQSAGSVKRPNEGPLSAGFEISAAGDPGCQGRRAHIEVDWVRARDFVNPEPQVQVAK